MSYDVYIGSFWANYTYNVGRLFHDHIGDGEETGLQALDGLTGKQAHRIICGAFDRIHNTYLNKWVSGEVGAKAFCDTYNAPNGWGSTAGGLIFLARIACACAENPRKKVHVS